MTAVEFFKVLDRFETDLLDLFRPLSCVTSLYFCVPFKFEFICQCQPRYWWLHLITPLCHCLCRGFALLVMFCALPSSKHYLVCFSTHAVFPCVDLMFFFFTCVLLTRPCTKVCVSPVVSVSPSCVNRCAPPCLAACFLVLWCLFVLSGFLFNLIWTLWRMCVHIASPAVHVSLQTDWVARHKYNRVQHWKTAKMEAKHVIIGLNFSTSAVILSAGCWGTWDFIENDR